MNVRSGPILSASVLDLAPAEFKVQTLNPEVSKKDMDTLSLPETSSGSTRQTLNPEVSKKDMDTLSLPETSSGSTRQTLNPELSDGDLLSIEIANALSVKAMKLMSKTKASEDDGSPPEKLQKMDCRNFDVDIVYSQDTDYHIVDETQDKTMTDNNLFGGSMDTPEKVKDDQVTLKMVCETLIMDTRSNYKVAASPKDGFVSHGRANICGLFVIEHDVLPRPFMESHHIVHLQTGGELAHFLRADMIKCPVMKVPINHELYVIPVPNMEEID
ncbi:hypothetical protein ONE63_003394 [Megalurothrips usitatus]|uniref:Uncharacterized protein n=1 Tax=Megalurothrips usitatus TaxID=439358 RepID=A0AAV7XD68_9NEOP|nr:hypothetical protein ONE63_003394 [Megalurothrips usitatus]